MRRFLERGSASAIGLVTGPVVALLWALWLLFVDGLPLRQAALLALAAAPVFGLTLALVVLRLRRRLDDAVGAWPEGREHATRRAAWRGPVPLDPEVRDGALRLAVAMRDGIERQWWAPPGFIALMLTAVLLARSGSPWWWLGAAEFAGLLLLHLFVPRHLERRAEELERLSSSRPGRRTPV